MPENKLYLLSKCVERLYAEKLFYDGILHFGYPYIWIEKGKNGFEAVFVLDAGEWTKYTNMTYDTGGGDKAADYRGGLKILGEL